VIVTLPDPVSSRLDLDFDRRVDAIESAALDANYIPDHFWLPWVGVGVGVGIGSDSPENSTRSFSQRALEQVRLSEPGLEVFRSRNYGNRNSLFVFFVGETPTSGVNLVQLKKAVDYVGEVQEATGHCDPIKFLGPSFSGSIPALVQFLQRRPELFDVIPSSATDNGLLLDLQSGMKDKGTVRSVLHDDATSLERFLTYAQDVLHIDPSQVAVISESQTAYGESVNPGSDKSQSTGLPGSAAKQNYCPDNGLRFCVNGLSFPREIYRLRSAYPDPQHLAAGGAQPQNLPNSGLDMNLKLSPGGEDGVPSFSGEQLPLSQEAVMLSIADTIRQRKIKLAGVAATDVFDSLFVLRFLRELCPDTRLFILDSDLLFVRAADNLSLQGTLAVTDYPLSTAIQPRDDTPSAFRHVRFQTFPSRYAAVTYNALLALLQQPIHGYLLTDPKSQPAEPNLWLTVISRNGFEPVHRLTRGPNEPDSLPFVDSSTGEINYESRPSGGYLLLTALLGGFTIAHLVLLGFAARPKAQLASWAVEFFYISAESTARAQKAYFLATAFVVLTILDLIVFLPIWRMYWFHYPWVTAWYDLLCLATILISLGSVVAAVWLCARHNLFLRIEGRWMALSWLIAFCYYFAWFVLTCWRGDDSLLFLHRSIDLSSGTSPLLPHFLLLICFYLWAASNVRRVHVWETRRQTIEFSALDVHYRAGFKQLEDNLSAYFFDLFQHRFERVLLLVVPVYLFLRPLTYVSGFEPFHTKSFNAFDTLYVVYLLLFITLLLSALIRFVTGWAALLKILRRLERQPIRHAFDRLPKKFYSWTPIWHAGGARKTYSLQTRELECLQKLESSAGRSLPFRLRRDLPGLVNQLQASAWRLLDAEANCYLDLQSENWIWQQNLISTGDRILWEFLVPHWRSRGDCESIDQYDREQSVKPDQGVRHLIHNRMPVSDANDIAVIAEEFIALRMVAFLRYVGVQLRNLLSFVAAGFILCVASIRSYPFLAHGSIGWALTVTFFALGIPMVIAFAQMDKDAALSRLSDTDPGKLDRAFYLRLVSYGGLPLLTVLASQFPVIGRFLFSWVQPAIAALH